MDTLNQFIQRMRQDLQLRGMSQPTQDNYTRSVRKLSEHYHKLPDQITEEEIRDYFLFLKNVKKYGCSTSTLVRTLTDAASSSSTPTPSNAIGRRSRWFVPPTKTNSLSC